MKRNDEPSSFVDRTIFWFKYAVTENYINFEGRAHLREFWHYVLGNFILAIGITIIPNMISSTLGTIVSFIYTAALLLPGLSLGIRRLHDTDRSGWWLLISFIPIVGFIVLIVFYCQPGTPGPNMYGPQPALPSPDHTTESQQSFTQNP